MSVAIVPVRPEMVFSFHAALDTVAREKRFIEMTEAFPVERLMEFQNGLIAKNLPLYYAVDGEKVVGWCDISVSTNPRLAHRGVLGMGLLAAYRGKGLGRQLIETALAHAERIGLEKVELHVYASNEAAIRLYDRVGFIREGLIKNYRKLEGVKYDCVLMAKTFAS